MMNEWAGGRLIGQLIRRGLLIFLCLSRMKMLSLNCKDFNFGFAHLILWKLFHLLYKKRDTIFYISFTFLFFFSFLCVCVCVYVRIDDAE